MSGKEKYAERKRRRAEEENDKVRGPSDQACMREAIKTEAKGDNTRKEKRSAREERWREG